jgi:catechol 2,3-dioxygenase-like lactoylglutathione lyase family enzyme
MTGSGQGASRTPPCSMTRSSLGGSFRSQPGAVVPPAPRLHHTSLTVTSLERSVPWYREVLGLAEPLRHDGARWQRVVWRTEGVTMSLTVHDRTDAHDRFDESRVGMDHLAFGCTSRAELDEWVAHLDALGVEHGPVVEAPHAHLVVAHDPDGIPVEFYWFVT